jgi:16S rRNA (cytosine967-C5)-methyltransferase
MCLPAIYFLKNGIMIMNIDTPREIALKILYDISEKGAYSNLSLNKYLDDSRLRDIDKAFITELVYGTVKWRLTIDWIIDQFSSVKLKKLSPWILNVLRLGVYQLLYTDRIPESAACNESVKLSKKYGHAASSGFVNAVLRNISRKRDTIQYPDKEKEGLKFLSIRYSHPEWLVKEWLERFGSEFTEGLLKSNNEVPELTIRTNTLKVSKEQLAEQLAAEGITVEPGKYDEDALGLTNPSSITALDSYRKGLFQVQDESSMLVARILDPQPGEFILDVCSAPGGKATHIAQLMRNQGTLVARDIHEHKIRLIQNASERLGTSIIRTEMFDASELDARQIGKADRVLVDAPCTGLGIVRRKPDIKWARNLEDKKEIISLQEKILGTCARYVKPGGTLVYSTCTIEREENEGQIESFLRDRDEFRLVDITSNLPSQLVKESAAGGYIQLYPHIDGIDGFFIAKLIRRS